MNTTKIFRNSWDLARLYRALWVFGVILALTTVSFGSALWLGGEEDDPADQTIMNWELTSRDRDWIKENFGFDLPLRYTLTVEDLQVRLDDPALSSAEQARLLRQTITILVVLFILLTIVLVLRYTAETALIRMVSDRQYKDQVYSIRRGWAMGFSLTALKLFLIDLVGIILLITVTMVLPLPALIPLFIAINGSAAAISVSLLLMTSLMLLSLAIMIPMWIAGHASLELAKRACTVEGLGIFASLWRGLNLMRAQVQGVGLTWFVIAGLDLVYPILVVPAGILLAAAGLAVGGGLALALGALLALVLAKVTAWTVAGIFGLVLLVLSVSVPLAWLGGLREVFKSAAWTLTFGEAVRTPAVKPASAPDKTMPQAAAA